MLQVHASVFEEPETDGEENQKMGRRDGISGRTPPRGRTGVGDGELCLSTSGDQGNSGEDTATEHGDERLKRWG